MNQQLPALIVGTGPAGLMAADLLSAAGHPVELFERRPAPGWKLLVAGSSGLNISHGGPEEELFSHYTSRKEEIRRCLAFFTRSQWIDHLQGLGEETFLGTSRRYFLSYQKASRLLLSWRARLEGRGVKFHFSEELVDFTSRPEEQCVSARFQSGKSVEGRCLLLSLGSPSWEDAPPPWPLLFTKKNIPFTPFEPANAGWEIEAPPGFFAKAEGMPVKGITLSTRKGSRTGECMITRYGLEGTPVYTMGCQGLAEADLKPDMALASLVQRLKSSPANQRWKAAKLSEGARALVEAFAPANQLATAEGLAHAIKHLSIPLSRPRPLTESISASGGVSWDALGTYLELLAAPGVFCAGEMVDWDAPTGGFLLQASVSMGALASAGMKAKLS